MPAVLVIATNPFPANNLPLADTSVSRVFPLLFLKYIASSYVQKVKFRLKPFVKFSFSPNGISLIN